MRNCSQCKKEKNEKEFYTRKERNSYISACKSCTCSNNKKKRALNKKLRKGKLGLEAKKESKRLSLINVFNKIKRRKYWIDRYKLIKGCSNCGYKEASCALDFDHINPKTKDFQPTSNLGCSLKRIFSELKKCQILCSNCHRIKTFGNSLSTL